MPATASRTSPAIPNGKSTCSSTETRVWRSASRCEAGPHVVGVSFVRELWEPEGLPQPLQRGRVITDDQVYMDYANVGSVQIGGPYRTPDRRRTRPAVARFSSASPGLRGRAGVRDEDPFTDRPARVSAAGDEAGCADAARVLRQRPAATAEALTPGFSSRSNGCSSTRTSFCASIGIRSRQQRRQRRLALSSQRPRSGLAPVVLPVEQHPRRSLAGAGRARTADESGDP